MNKRLKSYIGIKKSYRGIIFAIALAIVVVNIITLISYTTFRDNLIAKEQEQLLTIAEATSKTLEDFVDEKVKDSNILVQTIVDDYHDAYRKDEISDYIAYSLNNYHKIQTGKVYQVQFFDEHGNLIHGTIPYTEMIDSEYQVNHYVMNNELKETLIGEIFELPSGYLAFDITTPLYVDGTLKGHLRFVIKMDTLYELYVEEIRIGSKGYASIKDSTGVLIMHPKKEDIGSDVMKARKTEFPEYDWSELEHLVEIQKSGQSGTGIYHSIWYHDEVKKRVKKFSAFAPIHIGDDFWIVTVSMDYKELSDLATNYFYNNLLIIGFVPIVLVVILIYILNLRKNINYLEREQDYLQQVSELNIVLEEDIEERKKLEKALYASKERFKQLFNAGTDLTFVLFKDEKTEKYEITRVNDMACIKLGRERDELIGLDFLALTSDMTQASLDDFLDQIEQDELTVFEVDFTLSNGISAPYEISGQVFTLENKTLMMLIARDVSKKKAQEEQLEKNRALLTYKFRLVAMGEMIANIAHQWRQPLGSLNLMIANLEDAFQHEELTEHYFNETVENSRTIIRKMSAIIDDFRYFFNPKQDKAPINIERQITSALEMVQDRLKIDEVKVILGDRSHHEIYGFGNQLSQVVLNIINNAIDAMKDRDNRLIKIRIDEKDDAICIRISNNGELIPEDILPKVFDPYFTTKESGDGTGIGLYMTKMIIESNFNGSIKMFNDDAEVVTEILLPIEG